MQLETEKCDVLNFITITVTIIKIQLFNYNISAMCHLLGVKTMQNLIWFGWIWLQFEAEKSGVLNFITITRCGCSGVFRF